jgi:hypothetical protein
MDALIISTTVPGEESSVEAIAQGIHDHLKVCGALDSFIEYAGFWREDLKAATVATMAGSTIAASNFAADARANLHARLKSSRFSYLVRRMAATAESASAVSEMAEEVIEIICTGEED